jgi:hypothetical protein
MFVDALTLEQANLIDKIFLVSALALEQVDEEAM